LCTGILAISDPSNAKRPRKTRHRRTHMKKAIWFVGIAALLICSIQFSIPAQSVARQGRAPASAMAEQGRAPVASLNQVPPEQIGLSKARLDPIKPFVER